MTAQPRVCVLRAPGTNCDLETAHAFDLAGGVSERIHLFDLLENPGKLKQYQILCVPGGFSYGDDIGAGVIFASEIRRQLGDVFQEHLQRETLTLGICNGFQVLLKAGVLPDGPSASAGTTGERTVTLTWNNSGKYIARWVHLSVDSPQSVFLKGIDTIEMPLAHAEGKLCVKDPAQVAQWQAAGQLAVRYCDAAGQTSDEVLSEEWNPNGSIANIAGLSDPTGRVLGLMPHPERFLFETQHPCWTRRNRGGNAPGDGRKLFENAIAFFG